MLRFLTSRCRISLVWIPYLFCVGGFLVNMFVFFPGTTTISEVVQYTQSLNGRYTDWHPPIIAATWRFLRMISRTLIGAEETGQNLFYFLQSLLIWGGLLIIFHSGKRFWRNMSESFPKTWWMVIVIGILLSMLWIDIVLWSRYLSKDNVMIGCYFIATGCLFNMPVCSWKKWGMGLLALLCLFYGTMLRHNAIFAVLPMLFWLVWHFFPDRSKKTLPIILCGCFLWGSFLLLNQYISYHVLRSYRLYPLQECFYGDIFRMNALSGSGRYQNPINSFGNTFDDLTEEIFLRDYESVYPFQYLAFKHIRHTLRPFYLMQESVEVVPDSEFSHSDKNGEESFVRYDHVLKRLEPDYEHVKLRILNENDVLQQYPKDYVLLRKAWFERIKAEPVAYFKIKIKQWLRYMTLSSLRTVYLCTGGLFNGLMMFTISALLCLFTFSSKRLQPNVMPFLMLSWSAVLIALPLLIFLPADEIRYLLWFFAAAFIALVNFCSHSEIFRKIVQTIQCRLEKKFLWF